MLAFVVLLLVGLASYTRIETAVAGNFQKQAQARQNAQLALDVALTQLQKHSGPDQRVTATAESFGGVNGTRYYTGVWNNDDPAAAPAWLTSGLEAGTVNVTAAPPAAQRVELVGVNTSGLDNANNVVARLMPITTVGVPGQAGATAATIGRYAWWIGDQGVKAPIGLRDTADGVDYAPFDSAELRSRIRQQISLGAGPANFEPRDAGNALLVPNLKAANQLAFLRTPGGGPVSLAALQANYAAWSPNNFNVLADTAGTGLRRDLSIDPSLLGASVQAWLDYASYMESPDASAISAFPPIPAIEPESIRRRYSIRAGSPLISPILTHFHLLVGVQKQNADSSYTVSLRWAATLWNPYAAALVPEDLKLEVSGLPDALVVFSKDPITEVETDDVSVSLDQRYGPNLALNLPWTAPSPALADKQSWLPGRVHNWVGAAGAALAVEGDNPGQFNSANIPGFSDGLLISVPGSTAVNGDTAIGVRLNSETILTVKLMNSAGDVLATYQSPSYDSVPRSDTGNASYSTTQLGFLFRLPDSYDFPAAPGTWLTTAAHDPRSATISPESLVVTPNGSNPAAYRNYTTVYLTERLLDRNIASLGYNEDAPVFELPRGPLLSLGALQHLALPGARPFSVGNSWGATADINGTPAAQLFDRFFFSGLTPAVTPSTEGNALVLPNPLLRVAPRSATGTPTTVDDLRTAPTARSSKFLLQGGAFNVNSTNVAAWAAVLRSVRFPAAAFNFLDVDPATGTAADTGETTASEQSGDARFFRFSQSAQETYKAESGLAAGAGNTSAANTHLFRQGMITLDADKVTALAAQIVALVRARHAASGPFRSLAEFLSRSADTLDAAGGQISLLEKAIADAAINVDAAGNPIEFSSQFLTQGDIMTALAPVLFPRSDTFVIRTYGEAVNPATGATEGRAWAEATVQRTPEYFDSTDDATVASADLNAINQTYGRRFKVVSFRWLTRADL
jgi:hypothetical protein